MTIVIFKHNRKNNSLLGSMQCFHFERFTETPLLGKDKFSGGRGSPPTTTRNIVTQIFQGFFSIFFKTCLKILIFQVPPPLTTKSWIDLSRMVFSPTSRLHLRFHSIDGYVYQENISNAADGRPMRRSRG